MTIPSSYPWLARTVVRAVWMSINELFGGLTCCENVFLVTPAETTLLLSLLLLRLSETEMEERRKRCVLCTMMHVIGEYILSSCSLVFVRLGTLFQASFLSSLAAGVETRSTWDGSVRTLMKKTD